MNRTLLIVIVVVLALGIGTGAAYAVSQALPAPQAAQTPQPGDEDRSPGYQYDPQAEVTPPPDLEDEEEDEDEDGVPLPFLDPDSLPSENPLPELFEKNGMRCWLDESCIPPGLLKQNRSWPDTWRYWGPQGMMPWQDEDEASGERITLEEALTLAQEYTAEKGGDLRVASIYEFEKLFYAVVLETDTGKGAFQLVIQPVSGKVRYESGPAMNWNTKYGRRQGTVITVPENTLTMAEAAAQAQQVLDEKTEGVTIDSNGIEFYGYYSFEYQVDGETAGILSVNAEDGKLWFHNWLGNFIGKKEINE